MSRLLRKLAQMSLPEELATTAWRGVSDEALRRGGGALYERELIPGFEETQAERVFLLPSKEEYAAQVARGERPHYVSESQIGKARGDMYNVKRTAAFLSKLSAAIYREADDGDFQRYVIKDHTTMGRDFSDQRDRDIQQGLDIAWQSHEIYEPGSETPPTSGKNNVLERVPQEQKYAGVAVRDHAHLRELAKSYADRIKSAIQSANSVEDSSYPRNASPHADLTDAQQSRQVGEAIDAIEHYAPQSPEGGPGNPVFNWSAHEKASQAADFSPDPRFVENEEARGLPQWPYILNDSRQAGQGDEPTARAWSEHDSFSVTNLPSVDAQGNPGPST